MPLKATLSGTVKHVLWCFFTQEVHLVMLWAHRVCGMWWSPPLSTSAGLLPLPLLCRVFKGGSVYFVSCHYISGFFVSGRIWIFLSLQVSSSEVLSVDGFLGHSDKRLHLQGFYCNTFPASGYPRPFSWWVSWRRHIFPELIISYKP